MPTPSTEELLTSLAQARAEAAHAQALLHQLTTSMPSGVLGVDADGRIQLVSAAYLVLLGLDGTADEWQGRPAHELQAMVDNQHGTDLSPLAEPDSMRVLADGHVLQRRLVRHLDGSYLEYLRHATREDLDEGMLVAASMPEHCPYPMVRYSLTGDILYANPAAWRLRQRLHAEKLEQVRGRFFQLAAEASVAGEARQLEMAIGGEEYLAHVAPFMEQGYLNLYLLNIADRIRAQAETRASEARLQEQQAFTQHILDSIPNTVVVRTSTGQEVFANRAFRALRAQSPSSDGPIMAAYYEAIERVLRTGRDEAQIMPISLQNGDVRWMHVELRRHVRPDAPAAILIVSTDVTDLTEAQRELARNERRYNQLMDYAQALIWTHDPLGRIMTANPALSNMLGIPAGEIVGRRLHDAFDEHRHSNVDAYLRHIRQAGEHSAVVKLRDMQGGLHYVQQYSRLIDEPGEEERIMAFGHDITERVLAERAMQQAKEAAEASASARANFLANMSHEIRTPLNGVLGMATLLAKTQLNARQAHYLDVIRSSGQHLLGVINDVLDMAKISSGKLELEQAAFNLCDSMAQAIQPLVEQARQKGITFSGTPLKTSCLHPWIVGDAHRLNQILINLTANAVKFTEAGGHIDVVGRQLSETADTVTVEFRVTDTGPGIAPERIERIFESFTQAYADTSRRHGGTGLGLTISRALVEQMGGQLTVESEEGRGSVFSFSVTLPKAEQTIVQPVSELDKGELRGKCVLLVEDNEINRDVARLLLEEWGVVVEEAKNGEEGVARFMAGAYDAVLMDIQMPGLNGLEATARLRRHPDALRAATPIVALTANAFREDNEHYLSVGMNATLAKPFEEADLYNVLVQVLAHAPVPEPAYNLGPLRDMARGKEAFVTKIIRSFLANIPDSLAALRTAAAAGQWPEVARLVHHIKPNLKALRVTGGEGPVALLEQFRHDVPVHLPETQLHDAADELIRAVQRALDELPRELPQEEA